MRITEFIQRAILQYRHSNLDIAVDATVGKGNDTLFLAENFKFVFGFDIQPEALAATNIKVENYKERVQLIEDSHANLFTRIPAEYVQSIGVVMFNLGYLPTGNKSITTLTSSTMHALNQCLYHLPQNALISVVAYPGHLEGASELDAISTWLAYAQLQSRCEIVFSTQPTASNSPVGFVLRLKHNDR